ncbi:MAG: META domain-containing protein [Taibaiella sp.]|nr:META domain-containing protein [Taibaiella sp.]
MRYLKAILLVPVICSMFCFFSNDAYAQKKKKEKPRRDATLENTYWALHEMDGKTVETPANEREIYIKLVEKKSLLEGYGGCNIITGSYDLGKEYLTFEATATLRACDDMTKENYVFNALNNTNRYELNGQHLLLFNGTYLLAIFEARYYDDEK